MGQSEGITLRNNKYGYISNEKFVRSVRSFAITVNQKLRSFDISSFVTDHFTKYTFTGNGNWSNPANCQYNLVPPFTLVAGNEIIIDPVAGGMCELDIPFTMPAGVKVTISAGKKFLVKEY